MSPSPQPEQVRRVEGERYGLLRHKHTISYVYIIHGSEAEGGWIKAFHFLQLSLHPELPQVMIVCRYAQRSQARRHPAEDRMRRPARYCAGASDLQQRFELRDVRGEIDRLRPADLPDRSRAASEMPAGHGSGT